MHLVRCGSGDPVLFIHGMPTNGRLWSSVIQHICAQYTCFAIDLPGFGKSPGIDYGPEYLHQLAEQIELLRIMNGIEKWHVVGHDAGSAVAVHYARYFPQSIGCMALLSPALFPELKPYFLIEPLRKPVLGELLAPFIQALFWKVAMPRALSERQDREAIIADFHSPFSGPSGPWQFMQVLRWGKPADLLAEVPAFLPELRMPTMIFHGSQDRAIPAEFAHRASSLMPNAGLVTVDSGHFIPLQRPALVADSLTKFFQHQSISGFVN